MKRRTFINEIGRWLALGGLLGTSALLLVRKQIGNPESCFKNPYCKSCNQFSSCNIVADLKPSSNERETGK